MVVEYIDAHRDRVVAPSTYYAAKNRVPSARAVRDAELIEEIKAVHAENLGVYGARKVHAELRRKGVNVARCTVERLMRAEGLRGIPREKTRRTTVSDGAQTERPADQPDSVVRRQARGPRQPSRQGTRHICLSGAVSRSIRPSTSRSGVP